MKIMREIKPFTAEPLDIIVYLESGIHKIPVKYSQELKKLVLIEEYEPGLKKAILDLFRENNHNI